MEDLVEELIGDIKDEYDVDEAETTVRRAAATWRSTACSTSTTSRTRPASSSPRAPTRPSSGFLMARLGRLPQVDDCVDYAERRITVREVEGRRVGRVLVTAVPAQVVVDRPPVTIEVDRPGAAARPAVDQPDAQPDAQPDGRPADRPEGRWTTVPTT